MGADGLCPLVPAAWSGRYRSANPVGKASFRLTVRGSRDTQALFLEAGVTEVS